MERKEIDLLDHTAMEYIEKKTALDPGTVQKIFLSGKPWFTIGEAEKNKGLKNLAREFAECILEENENFKKKVEEVSSQTGEPPQKVQKVLWGIIDYQIRLIEALLHNE